MRILHLLAEKRLTGILGIQSCEGVVEDIDAMAGFHGRALQGCDAFAAEGAGCVAPV
jgi:hypothetical protein